MLPPIPSPTARDCANCGVAVENGGLVFCPHCGAALKREWPRFSHWRIAGMALLATFSFGTGSRSILFLSGPAHPIEYLRDTIHDIALTTLVVAVLGFVWIGFLLRPLWRRK